jgi:hypothetical protein
MPFTELAPTTLHPRPAAHAAAAPMLVTDPATGRPALQFDGTNSQYLDVTSVPSIVIEGDISTFCAFNPNSEVARRFGGAGSPRFQM